MKKTIKYIIVFTIVFLSCIIIHTVSNATEYDLYVGGVQVTDEKLSGQGWNFDPQTNTLYLNNATIYGSSESSYLFGSSGIRYLLMDKTLNVVATGTNNIYGATSSSDTSSCGIYACDLVVDVKENSKLSFYGGTKADDGYTNSYGIKANNVTLKGKGQLTASGGTGQDNGYGIKLDANLTIEEGNILIQGGENIFRSYGIHVVGDVTINGGKTKVISNETDIGYGYGIQANNIYINDGGLEVQSYAFSPGRVFNNVPQIADGLKAIASVNSDGSNSVEYDSSAYKTYKYFKIATIEPKPITKISLNKTDLTLKNGSSETLQVTITPLDTTDDKTILWSSNNTSVATVDSNGKVTCKACEGTATITVTSKANSSIKVTCKITASHKDSKLTLHSAVAATCNKAGNTAYYTCSGCDNYYSDEAGKNKISDKSSVIVPIDVNAHTWDNGKVTKEATCTANGEKTYTCKNNSSHTKKETINATGHAIVKVPFVKPTYEKEGNIEHYKCTNCNTLYSDSNGNTIISASDVKLEKMPFPDVEYGKWYVDYVKQANNKGLITGYANGKFGPNDTITRAQVATILYRMAGTPSVSGNTGLKDEDTFSGWYKDAVTWAFNNGIITGYGSGENAGKFVPNNNVSREELMIMFMRYAKNIKNLDVSVEQSLDEYEDFNLAHNYALEGIKWTVNKGIISGKTINNKKYLDPLGTATRAEMAKMIKVFCEL